MRYDHDVIKSFKKIIHNINQIHEKKFKCFKTIFYFITVEFVDTKLAR